MKSSNTKANHAICRYAGKCGGCQLQNLTYPDQLLLKQTEIIRLIGRYCEIPPVIGMDSPIHYRHKVQAAFGVSKGGQPICGVFQSSSHRIVPVDSCMIEDEGADRIIQFIKSVLPSFHIKPYDIRSGQGDLRHVLIRKSHSSGHYMVVLVTSTGILSGSSHLAKRLAAEFPEIETVVQNINGADTSLVLGKKDKVLYGSGRLEDTICGKRFLISPRSFFQVNPLQTEILYSVAVEFANLTGTETVVDAYCGTGTIGIVASDKAKRVIGIELNPDAVEDAKLNAKRNNVSNIRFVCSDSGEYLRDLSARPEISPPEVLFTDPPRSGCSKQFLDAVVSLSPDRIVYVSCNPESLARDAAFLMKHNYRISKAQPIDMFPYTNHVETVVLLRRKNIDDHLEFMWTDEEFGDHVRTKKVVKK